MLGTPKSANATGSGRAAAARIKDGGSTNIVTGLTVGTSGTDIVLNSVSITTGQQVSITSGSLRIAPERAKEGGGLSGRQKNQPRVSHLRKVMNMILGDHHGVEKQRNRQARGNQARPSAFLRHPTIIVVSPGLGVTYPDPALHSREPRPVDWSAKGFQSGRCRIATGTRRQHCGRNV